MLGLLKRLRRRGKSLAHWNVTVYSREQCCCCHKAIDLLEDYRRRHGFAIQTVDVDTDPALIEAHGLSVPVVEINGKVRFRGVVNPTLLDRLIEADSSDD